MRTLVIGIRGWCNTGDLLLFGREGGELTAAFRDSISNSLTDTEVWCPDVDMGMHTTLSPEELSMELFQQIDEKASSSAVDSIVLLGYSAGSVLARRVFCRAHGANEHGQFVHAKVAWADKIDRMVNLAGITRGWEFSTASPDHVRFLAPVLLSIASGVTWFRRLLRNLLRRKSLKSNAGEPFIWQLQRGSPFIVSTRLQYIEVLRRIDKNSPAGSSRAGLENGSIIESDKMPPEGDLRQSATLRAKGLPSTVFLLGAKDEFISPADCIELGPRAELVYIELPNCDHTTAIQIVGNSDEAQLRKIRLAAAISEPLAELQQRDWVVQASDIDDYLDPMDLSEGRDHERSQREAVSDVVMIIHGIRDSGFWTKRVAREIKHLSRENGILVRAPTPTYGYFSMWDFVRPGGRQRATRWFLERYAEVRSNFPNAQVSFVGHSNGTYLAARALEVCPAVEFKHVVFAGSVVRRSFAWSRQNNRVKKVLNYIGGGDGVVAFLPAVFEFLRIPGLDVGGAGAFGFQEAERCKPVVASIAGDHPSEDGWREDAQRKVVLPEIVEIRYVHGGHPAAIQESFWPEIARFALLGTLPNRTVVERGWWTRTVFRFAPVFTVIGVVIAVGLLMLPLILPVGLVAMQGLPASDAPLFTILLVACITIAWLTFRFLKRW